MRSSSFYYGDDFAFFYYKLLFVKLVSPNFLGATLPRLSTKLGKRKPEKGNVEDMTVEERLAMLNTTNENAKVPHTWHIEAVLRIRIRRVRMFLGLLDPDPLVRGMDLDPDPSIIKQK